MLRNYKRTLFKIRSKVINGINVINKYAFLVHEATLYDHWRSIWNELNDDEYIILLTETFRVQDNETKKKQEFVQRLKNENLPFRFVDDLLNSNTRYLYIISNHVVAGSRMNPCTPAYEQYISLRCGIKPIRIMYGADISNGWSLANWNEQYEYFFCHGPNDAQAFQTRFNKKTYQIGYPRYDNFFNEPIDRYSNPIYDEFRLSKEKKNIIWLPTLGKGVCSIPSFAKAIHKLSNEFNIIVRPHPIAFRDDITNIELLRSYSFNIDSNDTRDMNVLYSFADYVICDYGGTAFSALYLDKNLILLNVDGSETWYTSKNSSDMELRKLLSPVISVEDSDNLAKIINDKNLWDTQIKQRATAFKKFFAPYRGTSTKRVVNLLRELP